MGEYDVKREVTDKYSLRGRVYHRLREDILNGRYEEHEELREIAISEELGVSRTPVREAFRQLELEGLLTIVPNKGAYVSGITLKDVSDIYAIRARLEGLCARWATRSITKEQLELMEETIYLSDFHARKGHSEQLTELDNQFHEILYQACSSKRLEHLLRDYHEYVMRVRKWILTDDSGRGLVCVQEHRQIMEAIRSRDADGAERLATLHMQNAYANMLKNGLDAAYERNGDKGDGKNQDDNPPGGDGRR